MYKTGGLTRDATESVSCVFKIDQNLNVKQMMPMAKARSFLIPVFVKDRYLLAIGGHSDPS